MADSDETQGTQGDPVAEKQNDGQQGDPGADDSNLKKALEAERKAARDAQRLSREQATELESLRKEKAARADAEKTELERAEARAQEAEKQIGERDARIREQVIRSAVLVAASKANAIDPDAVLALIDRNALVVENDAVTNADAIVAELLKAKVYLLKPEDGGTAIPGTPKAGKPPTSAELVNQTRQEMRASGQYRL